jgi:hypothetical protein
MPKMIITVLDDVNKLHDVMEAWHQQGASGVTVIESIDLARLALHSGRDDLPLFPAVRNLLREREVHHRTVFTVVSESIDVEAFFDATEAIVGHLYAGRAGPTRIADRSANLQHATGALRDVQPFVALGLGLKWAGPEVRLVKVLPGMLPVAKYVSPWEIFSQS